MKKRSSQVSRRQAIAGVAVAVGQLALNPTDSRADGKEEISRSAESIHQEITIHATCMRVYDALIDAGQFDKVTHLSDDMKSMPPSSKPTQISREAGGTFVLFGGHIVGRQLELFPGKRIVQAWRVVTWEPGVYSIARFEFKDQGNATTIVFDHTGFPKGFAEHLAEGWRGHYWDTLAKFLA